MKCSPEDQIVEAPGMSTFVFNLNSRVQPQVRGMWRCGHSRQSLQPAVLVALSERCLGQEGGREGGRPRQLTQRGGIFRC